MLGNSLSLAILWPAISLSHRFVEICELWSKRAAWPPKCIPQFMAWGNFLLTYLTHEMQKARLDLVSAWQGTCPLEFSDGRKAAYKWGGSWLADPWGWQETFASGSKWWKVSSSIDPFHSIPLLLSFLFLRWEKEEGVEWMCEGEEGSEIFLPTTLLHSLSVWSPSFFQL